MGVCVCTWSYFLLSTVCPWWSGLHNYFTYSHTSSFSLSTSLPFSNEALPHHNSSSHPFLLLPLLLRLFFFSLSSSVRPSLFSVFAYLSSSPALHPSPASVLRNHNDRLWNKGAGMVTLIMMMAVLEKWQVHRGRSVDGQCGLTSLALLSQRQRRWERKLGNSKTEDCSFLFSYFLSFRDLRPTQCPAGYAGACVGPRQSISIHFYWWGTWKRLH